METFLLPRPITSTLPHLCTLHLLQGRPFKLTCMVGSHHSNEQITRIMRTPPCPNVCHPAPFNLYLTFELPGTNLLAHVAWWVQSSILQVTLLGP